MTRVQLRSSPGQWNYIDSMLFSEHTGIMLVLQKYLFGTYLVPALRG
jgi:hypothetical protein